MILGHGRQGRACHVLTDLCVRYGQLEPSLAAHAWKDRQHLGSWVVGIVEDGRPRLHYKILSQPSLQPRKEWTPQEVWVELPSLGSAGQPLCSLVPVSLFTYLNLSLSPVSREERDVGHTRKRSPFSIHVEEERWGNWGLYVHIHTHNSKILKKPFYHWEFSNWCGSTVTMFVLQVS